MFRRSFMVLFAGGVAACVIRPRGLSLPPNAVLIILRHADRDGDNLSVKGRKRAHDLVGALDRFEIDAIYSPGIQRNLDTAAPLATARNLTVQRIAQESPTPELVANSAGKTIVWVGNKGNLTRIWEDLRLTDPAPLTYGDLFIVRSDALGAVTIERRVFGPQE